MIIQKMKPNDRAVQILKTLTQHGSLTVSGLKAILQPPIHTKRLRESLARLHKKKLLEKLYDRQFGNSAVYHQIAQNPLARGVSARLLGVSPESLSQPHFRHAELIHSQSCAVWSERLKVLAKNFRVLREHEFSTCSSIQERLQAGEREFDLRPDLMLIHTPATSKARPVMVGVEIERTRKTHKRLYTKLKKYASQSSLDGVVYICPHGIGDRVKQIYNSQVLQRSPRIKHYGNYFLLFLDGTPPIHGHDPVAHNAAMESVSLTAWLQTLVIDSDENRRDRNFG